MDKPVKATWPKQFRSCFIVDVDILLREIVLTDSAQNRFFIDTEDSLVVAQFKQWFDNIFTKGIAQTLTVFQYKSVDISECESKLYIKKFCLKNDSSKKIAEVKW